MPKAIVDRPRDALIDLVFDIFQSEHTPESLDTFRSAVLRAVIYHNQLKILIGLIGDALKCAGDIAFAIEDGHYNADLRIHLAYPSDQRPAVALTCSAF